MIQSRRLSAASLLFAAAVASWWCCCCNLVVWAKVATDGTNSRRKLLFTNSFTGRVHLYWVNPGTRETILMDDPDGLVPGAEFPLDTFVGHEFEIRQKSAPGAAGKCPDAPDQQTCRSAHFAISENNDQQVTLNADFEAIFVDSQVKAQEKANTLIASCRKKAQRRLAQTVSGTTSASSGGAPSAATAAAASPDMVLQEMADCVAAGVSTALEKVDEEIAFQADVRTEIAHKLENYTCLDDSLESTPDLRTEVWKYDKDGVERVVHVKHARPSSNIHLIENFINPAECKAMAQAAEASLHRATVADGKGGSRLSENRKAMQAGITVPWHKEHAADTGDGEDGEEEPDGGQAIARLSRRVYDYTNHVLGLNIDEFGQEDLMSIQYFGRGENDTEPDRYTPHCDGDCTGQPHKTGTRMATLVMYCNTATRGGHTNFRNAGVHIKPVVGAGIFFSYINPTTLEMDKGFTEHSGCPVFEGHKEIVTQWVRMGVDLENPWDSFNTLGMKKSEIIDD